CSRPGQPSLARRRCRRRTAETARGGNSARAGLHPARRHERNSQRGRRPRSGVAMTTLTTESAELVALRELADDIFAASTEPALDVQQVGLDFDPGLWATLNESGLTLL